MIYGVCDAFLCDLVHCCVWVLEYFCVSSNVLGPEDGSVMLNLGREV